MTGINRGHILLITSFIHIQIIVHLSLFCLFGSLFGIRVERPPTQIGIKTRLRPIFIGNPDITFITDATGPEAVEVKGAIAIISMKQQYRKVDSDAYVPAALSCAIKIQYPRIPWMKISKMAKRTVSASRFILRAMPPAARVLYFVSQGTVTRSE